MKSRSVALLLAAIWAIKPVWVEAQSELEFDYMMHCQGCHLPQGQGYPGRNVPAINNHLAKFLHVPGGREFLIQVPGSAQSDLNSERLAALINWMLKRFSAKQLPANFKPYTAAEVAVLRAQPLVDVNTRRAQLIKQIQALGL
ncbi:MAG: cytochrome c, class I [Cellvibrionaceae bacterium]|nr:cytochrome c, class I [Cellvibrionaceae bacterium]MCV6626434.1 cytochrome c, class I [Cellvibrionaceae bacterium]